MIVYDYLSYFTSLILIVKNYACILRAKSIILLVTPMPQAYINILSPTHRSHGETDALHLATSPISVGGHDHQRRPPCARNRPRAAEHRRRPRLLQRQSGNRRPHVGRKHRNARARQRLAAPPSQQRPRLRLGDSARSGKRRRPGVSHQRRAHSAAGDDLLTRIQPKICPTGERKSRTAMRRRHQANAKTAAHRMD